MKEKEYIPNPRINRVGEHYGHWIIKELDLEESKKSKRITWKCECDCGCGTTKSLRWDALIQVKIGGCKNMTSSTEHICPKCNKKFFMKKNATTRKFCYDCMPETGHSGAQYRKFYKQWGVEYKGSKCQCCGYNNCLDALEFHHLNPNEKDFNISDRNLTYDWEKIKNELDKCILVCANCHREIHAGIKQIKEVKNKNAD